MLAVIVCIGMAYAKPSIAQPVVTSIDIAQMSPNNFSSDTFTVTFSTGVVGVDATDFVLVGSGTASGSVSAVSGSGSVWSVTVGAVI